MLLLMDISGIGAKLHLVGCYCELELIPVTSLAHHNDESCVTASIKLEALSEGIGGNSQGRY